jgi:DNA-binding NarL/FixJ family response regulator
MLVDDHPTSREPLVLLLEREPDLSVVGEAGSLAEARAVLAAGAVPDMALIDLNLPDGHGETLIRDLRRTNPRALALIVTGSHDRRDHARAVAAGAAHVLHKSTSTRGLVEAIRRLSAGEVLLDPREAAELIRFSDERGERDAAERAALARLTARELEVLALLAEGLDNQAIANRLYVGAETAKTHVANLLRKLGVDARLQAILLAHRHGIGRPD